MTPTWAIVVGAVVAVVALVLWLARSSATPAWHDTARSEELRAVLADRGLAARTAPRGPTSMPQLRLPLAWSFRSRAGAEAGTGGARWLLYDTETRGRPVMGCNSAPSSSGDDGIARHTVVAIDAEGLALPSFTLLPNVRQQLERAIPDRFREAGLGDSKLAGWASKAAGALARLEERGTALPFPEFPDFVDAFRVVGEDTGAVRGLFDREAMALLVRRPWAIVEGQGRWLVVSRNTAEAYRTRDELRDDGLLSVESAREAAELASELAARWSRPSNERPSA